MKASDQIPISSRTSSQDFLRCGCGLRATAVSWRGFSEDIGCRFAPARFFAIAQQALPIHQERSRRSLGRIHHKRGWPTCRNDSIPIHENQTPTQPQPPSICHAPPSTTHTNKAQSPKQSPSPRSARTQSPYTRASTWGRSGPGGTGRRWWSGWC